MGRRETRNGNTRFGQESIKIFSGKKPCKLWTKVQLLETIPDDGGGDGLRNVGFLSTTGMACCPRRFYRVQSQ
jgi:hypothetical protein